jgi:N-acetylglucosamine-6-phosphate deacetylase
VPAHLVGHGDLAALRPGVRADLVVVDAAGALQRTLLAGKEVTPR